MQITRTELYERVCGSPLSKVAPDLGITGTALAAICKKHKIPYPGSGHWTRMLLGMHSEVPPLPDGDEQVIIITPSTPRVRVAASPIGSKPRKAKVGVKPTGPERHPILVGVEVGFRKTREVKDGEFLRPYKRILPDLISTEPLLPRALSIANDLYIALDKQGHRVFIAPADAKMHRIEIKEQEVERKDRQYGRHGFGSIWSPDRPTVTYIGAVPIGLAITEMTERVTMRYVNGDYHREDSKTVRSAKAWQLDRSWTTEQDLPCGRFRIVAYAPKADVNWSVSWQETETQSMGIFISEIVRTLEGSKGKILDLMTAADVAAAKRQREWEEQWERYNREEDKRRVAQAQTDSQQQLTDIIDKWTKVVAMEHFFAEAEFRLKQSDAENHKHIEGRLSLARSMVGTLDPLKFLEEWVAPAERYRSKYE